MGTPFFMCVISIYCSVPTEEPKITVRPTPAIRSLTVGYNVTFSCEATGLPTPTFEWKNPNKDRVSDFSPRFTIDGGTLTIFGIIKTDVGNWTCEAKNKRGTDKATVYIKEVLGKLMMTMLGHVTS